MTPPILSRRNLDFLLYEWLDVESLATRTRYADHARHTFDAMLDTSERLAKQRFSAHNRMGDRHEPVFDGERVFLIPEVKASLGAFADAGFFAAVQDVSLGGAQMPHVIAHAGMAFFCGANISTAAYALLTISHAATLLRFATKEQIDTFVRPMLAGRFFGTICLAEPQAGSSLSDIGTRAELQIDGTYRLFGSKMWIAGGDHELADNIVHLVLAKIPAASGKPIAGVKGLSLFIVPKMLVQSDGTLGDRNDVVLSGLNQKMGYRGNVNCRLGFGEGRYTPAGRPGAVGYLVGDPRKGAAQMFHMMNEARLRIGLGAVMLGYAGYLRAVDYARNRRQGRPTTARNASLPQSCIIDHADVKRMLLAQKAYVEGGLALMLYCARLLDEERTAETPQARRDATLLLDILAPVAKSWPSQWCLAANDLAIQVHGGYGYSRDFDVEQLYRDNRLNAIHEGTHGMQALDLLGRKVAMQGGAALSLLTVRMRQTATRADTHSTLGAHASALMHAVMRIGDVTSALYAANDIDVTLANASLYLEVVGHAVIAWLWLEQALVATTKIDSVPSGERAFYRGKLHACRYFYRFELPRIHPQLDLLAQRDTTTLDMHADWF